MTEIEQVKEFHAPTDISNDQLKQFISEHQGITKLGLNGCYKISDLTPLAGSLNLTELGLPSCHNISDLTPLSGLKKLNTLDLNGCKNISDLTPLAGLRNLSNLDLNGCDKISEAQVDLLKNDLPDCNIYHLPTETKFIEYICNKCNSKAYSKEGEGYPHGWLESECPVCRVANSSSNKIDVKKYTSLDKVKAFAKKQRSWRLAIEFMPLILLTLVSMIVFLVFFVSNFLTIVYILAVLGLSFLFCWKLSKNINKIACKYDMIEDSFGKTALKRLINIGSFLYILPLCSIGFILYKDMGFLCMVGTFLSILFVVASIIWSLMDGYNKKQASFLILSSLFPLMFNISTYCLLK